MTRRRLLFSAVSVLAVLLTVVFAIGLFWSSTEVTPDEYAVYSVVLEDYFVTNATGHAGNPSWVLIRSETPPHWNPLMFPVDLVLASQLSGSLEGLSITANWNWQFKRLRPASLARQLNFSLPYLFLPPAEFEERDPTHWDAIQNVLRAAGHVQLTRVGFDAERRMALVYFEHICGLCGEGKFVLLEREGEGWRIVEEAMTWVS